MTKSPNVGPEPVEADVNHVREKTFSEPNTPEAYKAERETLVENVAEDKVREDMPKAVDAIKKRLGPET